MRNALGCAALGLVLGLVDGKALRWNNEEPRWAPPRETLAYMLSLGSEPPVPTPPPRIPVPRELLARDSTDNTCAYITGDSSKPARPRVPTDVSNLGQALPCIVPRLRVVCTTRTTCILAAVTTARPTVLFGQPALTEPRVRFTQPTTASPCGGTSFGLRRRPTALSALD